MPSLTVENYAKAIYQLAQAADDGAVATGQISTALGVLPGTVTSMLKTLDESNLATYKPYEGVRLTPSGRALALRVLRRHRLIEQFLSETLNLTWDEVHEEAENMEHAVSDALIILPLMDGSIFTIYFNKVRRKAAQFAAKRLLDGGLLVTVVERPEGVTSKDGD